MRKIVMKPKTKIAKQILSRRHFLRSVGGTAVLASAGQLALSTSGSAQNRTPNFIFILSDDQGWNGTSVQMNPNRSDSKSDYHLTPNLKRLVNSGVRFTQGYCPAPLCCPTRRSLQFGQSPARMGYDRFPQRYPRTTERLTIPRLLKSTNSNYRAAHFGKWDLRTDLVAEDIGYDLSDGNTRNSNGNEGSNFGKQGKWSRYLLCDDPKQIFGITDRAAHFMENCVSGGQPFYLQISHYAVHVDMQTRPATFKRNAERKKGRLHHIPAFAGMTEDLDTGIGKILDKVEELGIADHTYIFYLADNGAVPWIPPDRRKLMANPEKIEPDRSRNHPLRSGKWTLFEGGIRVPFIIMGPGIAPNSICTAPVIGYDLLPTIADLAGYAQSLPDDLDGGSLRPLLEKRGKGAITRPFDFFVFHRYSSGYPHSAIRQGDFKYIKFWKSEKEYLFNLKENLGETHNLISRLPEKARALKGKMLEYFTAVDAEFLNQIR